jgi:hypothetical protein
VGKDKARPKGAQGTERKTSQPIPVPLNADQIAVWHRWKQKHQKMRPSGPRRCTVACSSHTVMWRWEALPPASRCDVVLDAAQLGIWHVQSEMPEGSAGIRQVPKPIRYPRVSPGHVVVYADRSLLVPDCASRSNGTHAGEPDSGSGGA